MSWRRDPIVIAGPRNAGISRYGRLGVRAPRTVAAVISPTSFNVPEEGAQGSPIFTFTRRSSGTVSGVSISSVSPANAVQLNANGLTLEYGSARINREAPLSQVTFNYNFTDAGGAKSIPVVLQVTDVVDGPTVTGAAQTLEGAVGVLTTGVQVGIDLRTLFAASNSGPLTFAANIGTIDVDGYSWSYTPTLEDYTLYGDPGSFEIIITATDTDGQTGVAELVRQPIVLAPQAPSYSNSTGTFRVLAGSAPVLQSAVPADGATNVSGTADLVLTYDRPIKFKAGSATVRARNVTDATDFDTLDPNVGADIGTSDGQMSISGAVLTVRPAGTMPAGKNMSYRTASGPVTNLGGIPAADFTDDTTLDWTIAGSATAPAQFQSADWSVQAGSTTGTVDLTISTLPNNGGSAITAIQFQVDGGAWASVGGTTTGTYTLSGNGLTGGVSANIAIRAVNAIGNGTASATKSATPPPLGTITVDSAALRFPDANADQATNTGNHGRLADGTNWAPSGNKIFDPATDCAFAVMCEVPWESWNRGGSTVVALLGNDGSQSSGQRMSIRFTRGLTDQAAMNVAFWVRAVNGGTILSGSVPVSRTQRRLLIVMAMRSGQMNFEVYYAGSLVGSVQPTMGAFVSMQLSSVLTYGSNGSGSGTNASTSGSTYGFNGSISHIGYNNSGLSQANCQNLSMGVDWLTEVAATTWRMYRRLTGTDATSLAKDAACINDSTASMQVINSQSYAFRNGSDLVPARSGSNWFTADYVVDGRVFPRAVGETTGRVFLSGNSSGLSGVVQARVFNANGQLTKDWTTLTGATLGGAWEGYLDAPPNAGWGHIDVRPSLSTSLVRRIRARTGVGLWITPHGQSQVERLNNIGTSRVPVGSAPVSCAYVHDRATSAWGITMHPITAERKLADALVGLMDEMANYTSEPLMVTFVSQGGTNPGQLMDDSDLSWSWAEIDDWMGLLLGPLARRKGGVVVINWYSDIMNDVNQPTGIMGNYYQPLITGSRAAGATRTTPINHYLLDGLTFPSGVKIACSVPTVYASGSAGPFDYSGTKPTNIDVTSTNAGTARRQWLDWSAANPSLIAAVGPWTDDLRMENSGGPHQYSGAASKWGHDRTLLRMVLTGLRAYGIDTRTDPSLDSASIDGGRTVITITTNRPNGGTLQTAWAIAGVSTPVGENVVQGFEVQDGGSGAWSRSTFDAVIAGNTVTLTKKTGSWAAGTKVRYLANGPLDYGTSLIPSELFHGCLYESGIDEGGIGLPLAGLWTATVA